MLRGTDNLLVNDVLCERAVIGSIISGYEKFSNVLGILDQTCFRDPLCLAVFKIVDKLYEQNVPIDLVNIFVEVQKEHLDISAIDISSLADNVLYANFEYHVKRLKELSIRRKIWKIGIILQGLGTSEECDIDEVLQKTYEDLRGLNGNDGRAYDLVETFKLLDKIIATNIRSGSQTTGARTGFTRIDEKGGLQPSDIIVIAGETSQGKTSFALTIALNVAQNGGSVAFYSMEMTKEQLAARILSIKSGVPVVRILYDGSLLDEELQVLDEAKGEIKGKNIFFDDQCTSDIDTIMMSIRSMKLQHDIKGAVIDYLQILSNNSNSCGQTRENIVGNYARRFKNLAKELGIWIIVLSQLNRSSGTPEPSLSRLRDSGQIAEAADIVILIYRAEVYNKPYPPPFDDIHKYPTQGTAMIDVAKGRNIGIFKFILNFDKSRTYFSEDEQFDDPILPHPLENDAPF